MLGTETWLNICQDRLKIVYNYCLHYTTFVLTFIKICNWLTLLS